MGCLGLCSTVVCGVTPGTSPAGGTEPVPWVWGTVGLSHRAPWVLAGRVPPARPRLQTEDLSTTSSVGCASPGLASQPSSARAVAFWSALRAGGICTVAGGLREWELRSPAAKMGAGGSLPVSPTDSHCCGTGGTPCSGLRQRAQQAGREDP